MVRYRHDGTADVIGQWNEPGVPSVPIGARIELDGETLTPKICRSGRPERVDDYGGLTGRLAERLQQLGIASGVGAPIIFDGELWGAVVVSSIRTHAFPARRRAPHRRLHRARGPGARQRRGARAARRVAGARRRRRRRRAAAARAQPPRRRAAAARRARDRAADRRPPDRRGPGGGARRARARERGAQRVARRAARDRARAAPGGAHRPRARAGHQLAHAARAVAGRADRRPRRAPAGGGRGGGLLRDRRVADQRRQVRAGVARERRGARARRPAAGRGQRRRCRRRRHRRGSGLLGLEDRVAALGGRLHIESPPGEGTSVRADVPIA